MKRLLVANRGAIARRVFRTARRMGLETVAVYSEADSDAPHVHDADQAMPIGPAEARLSYLSIPALLEAAHASGADAIHPGYGFLSENADFAHAVRQAGLIFVGPSADAIRAMGSKERAKAVMRAAGVPVVPGSVGEDQSLAALEGVARRLGFPLLIKAVAGGGGKGMRAAHRPEELADALVAARREAQQAFGDDGVLLERLVTRARHVEVQIVGDAHGSIVHLFERDCSVQRRHQKIVEEAPAPGLSERLRETLGAAAITAGLAIGYENAGTVEFLLDLDRPDEHGDPAFYFMEMNTRLQVEHGVTEEVTGIDLVEWQIRVARGEPLPLPQDAIRLHGHAFEARLYAERPEAGFLPATGTLSRLEWPHARIETGVETGSRVTPHYDPMLAKILVRGPDRESARRALVAALDETVVDGVGNNRAFLARLAAHEAFAHTTPTTDFLDHHGETLVAGPKGPPPAPALAAAMAMAAPPSLDRPRAPGDYFRLNLPPQSLVALWDAAGRRHVAAIGPEGIALDGATFRARRLSPVAIELLGHGRAFAVAQPSGVEIRYQGETHVLFHTDPAWDDSAAAPGGHADQVVAPMPGRIVRVSVAGGSLVEAGQLLLVMEAMKMEHRLVAPRAGRVAELLVAEGDQVSEGAIVARLADAS